MNDQPTTPRPAATAETASLVGDRLPYLDKLLMSHLRGLLQDDDPAKLQALLQHLEWLELPAGQTLMRQGEPGDAMYLLVIGRLRTTIADEQGQRRVIRDISRGEVVGELSLYTQEPRSATLVAVRDSVLVKLGKDRFEQLLAASPQVSIALTRQVIARLKTEGSKARPDRPVTMLVAPISPQVDAAAFADELARHMSAHGRVKLISQASLQAHFKAPGMAEQAQLNPEARRALSMMLDEAEAEHEFVLLLASAAPDAWTTLCARHSDELLLLADAAAPPALSALEREHLMTSQPGADPAAQDQAPQVLVLLHPAGTAAPSTTAAWLARGPVADHVHLRLHDQRDMARLARLQCRQALGLVLAGGGVRGFAYLGIARALQEHGVEIDVVGGTSIGSVMSMLLATDQPLDRICEAARLAFRDDPTGDFTVLPIISLIKGQRLRKAVDQAVATLVRPGAGIEDLWKGFFCIATNYSRAREEVLQRGSAVQAILASTAVPGALPPVVHDGDLLSDGGTFNNYPVDVMRRQRGVGYVVGVDLSAFKPRKVAFDHIPGPWALLRDRFRPKKARRYKLPSLSNYLINMTVLYSTAREAQAKALTDLHLHPTTERAGLLEWSRMDEMMDAGYRHAQEMLQAQAGSLPRSLVRRHPG